MIILGEYEQIMFTKKSYDQCQGCFLRHNNDDADDYQMTTICRLSI